METDSGSFTSAGVPAVSMRTSSSVWWTTSSEMTGSWPFTAAAKKQTTTIWRGRCEYSVTQQRGFQLNCVLPVSTFFNGDGVIYLKLRNDEEATVEFQSPLLPFIGEDGRLPMSTSSWTRFELIDDSVTWRNFFNTRLRLEFGLVPVFRWVDGETRISQHISSIHRSKPVFIDWKQFKHLISLRNIADSVHFKNLSICYRGLTCSRSLLWAIFEIQFDIIDVSKLEIND